MEMGAFLRQVDGAMKDADRERLSGKTRVNGKGSLRRDDFLRKVANAATESVSMPVVKALVHAVVQGCRHTYPEFHFAARVKPLAAFT